MKLFQHPFISLSFITSQHHNPHRNNLHHPSIHHHPSTASTASTRHRHHHRHITIHQIHQINNKMASSDSNEELIAKERAKSTFRYTEDIAPGLKLDMALHSILHTSLSEFQEVQVIDSFFGRTLVTDGKTQSAEHDEFVYHETLVHPPLLWSAILSGRNGDDDDDKGAAPKTVFIGGGGELATAREVLKHNTVERLVMVDIDPEVIEVCKKYLPEWGGNAVANHPKMELIVGDAHKYLMETTETFDVIIMDISDPIEAGPGIALYTQEFYRRASRVLRPKSGVFVTQAGSADFVPPPHAFPTTADGCVVDDEENSKESNCFGPILNTLGTVFDHAVPYTVPMPSFGEDWGFVMAFDGSEEDRAELVGLSSGTVDKLVEERIEGVEGVPEHGFRSLGVRRAVTGKERGGDALKHYDGEAHRGLFSLSKMLRGAILCDKRIMTVENPIFMY